ETIIVAAAVRRPPCLKIHIIKLKQRIPLGIEQRIRYRKRSTIAELTRSKPVGRTCKTRRAGECSQPFAVDSKVKPGWHHGETALSTIPRLAEIHQPDTTRRTGI